MLNAEEYWTADSADIFLSVPFAYSAVGTAFVMSSEVETSLTFSEVFALKNAE
jgi:hypothetical protein